MPAYGPRPEREHRPPDPTPAATLAEACLRTGRARYPDLRAFACVLPAGHAGTTCYGRDRLGLVPLTRRP